VNRIFGLVILGAAICCCARVTAVTIDTVRVGNAGNLPGHNGLGDVNYEYAIGKYEVTVGQYTEFLNAVAGTDTYNLYNPLMATDVNVAGISRSGVPGSYTYEVIGSPNKPVGYVNWGDAARFANWLSNGQPTGLQKMRTTEDGAYTLNGKVSDADLAFIYRNVEAQWFITSQDEWIKAAYHKNDGPTGNYWTYPTSSNSVPYSDEPPGLDAPTPSNTGNFYKDDGIANGYNDGLAVSGPNHLTDVGSYIYSSSPYGTFDQGGNAIEWLDTVVNVSLRRMRGGSAGGDPEGSYIAYRGDTLATNAGGDWGFRVVTLTIVPEPSSRALAAVALVSLVPLCRRQRVWVQKRC
jgi:formylglycine-generating enzyme required for sulfatase activity